MIFSKVFVTSLPHILSNISTKFNCPRFPPRQTVRASFLIHGFPRRLFVASTLCLVTGFPRTRYFYLPVFIGLSPIPTIKIISNFNSLTPLTTTVPLPLCIHINPCVHLQSSRIHNFFGPYKYMFTLLP